MTAIGSVKWLRPVAPSKWWRRLTALQLVALFSGTPVAATAIYAAAAGDPGLASNLVAEALGIGVSLVLGYLVIDRRLEEERRARRRPVERLALELTLAYAIGIVRRIGMFAGEPEMSPAADEPPDHGVQEMEAFAKRVAAQGFDLSEVELAAATMLVSQLESIAGRLFTVQRDYPFVFDEYHDVALPLLRLRLALVSLKDALVWAQPAPFAGPVPEFVNLTLHGDDPRKRRIEVRLGRFVSICDLLAEATSEHVRRLREPNEAR